MKESDNEIFERWAMVQDFGVPAIYATNNKAQEFLHMIKREPSAPIRKYIMKAAAK